MVPVEHPRPGLLRATNVTIEDRSGTVHVFLDPLSDDHIVTRIVNNAITVTLGYGEFAWERAVSRALRAVAFV